MTGLSSPAMTRSGEKAQPRTISSLRGPMPEFLNYKAAKPKQSKEI